MGILHIFLKAPPPQKKPYTMIANFNIAYIFNIENRSLQQSHLLKLIMINSVGP